MIDYMRNSLYCFNIIYYYKVSMAQKSAVFFLHL